MAMPAWSLLSEAERRTFHAATVFLNGRLEEAATIAWALAKDSAANIRQAAILDALERPSASVLTRPWALAWELIRESWARPFDRASMLRDAHALRLRLAKGERSGSLSDEIVELVAPALRVRLQSEAGVSLRRKPKSVEQLLWIELASGDVVDPSDLGLAELSSPRDLAFLTELATKLSGCLAYAISIANRLNWNLEDSIWRLGGLNRVYYVAANQRPEDSEEPDQFADGIAPSVKLLYATVNQIGTVDAAGAKTFATVWRTTRSPIHRRLWAALSRNPQFTPPDEVGRYLLECSDAEFWRVYAYPEVAELRARRFQGLSVEDRSQILARISKKPPLSLWRGVKERDRVRADRLSMMLRELRRLEIGDGEPPINAALRSTIASQEARLLSRIDEDFPTSGGGGWVSSNADNRYDGLIGVERLSALEAAFGSTARSFDNDPASAAADWMRQPGRLQLVIADLEETEDAGAAFPKIWDRLGWSVSNLDGTDANGSKDQQIDGPRIAARALSLLRNLDLETAFQAIEGISHLMAAWGSLISNMPEMVPVWRRLWKLAVTATNIATPAGREGDLNIVVRSSSEEGLADLDSYNTSAGRFVETFLKACPNLASVPKPFQAVEGLALMRDDIDEASGRAKLIAYHRLVEFIDWFLAADSEWTERTLVHALSTAEDNALPLWRAFARRPRRRRVIDLLGPQMAEKVVDLRLGRETRQSLLRSLTAEALIAKLERRLPALAGDRLQQTIRSADDEIRANAAWMVQSFVRDRAKARELNVAVHSPAHVFREAAKPFLETVWPQEQSLSSPAVSQAFAKLPVASGEAFAEAVEAVRRFLVPFKCWSLSDYGLRDTSGTAGRLEIVDSREKAEALLNLLDHTISAAEDAVVPLELGSALARIQNLDEKLSATPAYRRLATLDRR